MEIEQGCVPARTLDTNRAASKAALFETVPLDDIQMQADQQKSLDAAAAATLAVITTHVDSQQPAFTTAPSAVTMTRRSRSRSDAGLPVYSQAQAQSSQGSGNRSFLRYTSDIMRAIPRWIMRRSRPLLTRITSRINAHKHRLPTWLANAAAAAGSAASGSSRPGGSGSSGRLRSTVRSGVQVGGRGAAAVRQSLARMQAVLLPQEARAYLQEALAARPAVAAVVGAVQKSVMGQQGPAAAQDSLQV